LGDKPLIFEVVLSQHPYPLAPPLHSSRYASPFVLAHIHAIPGERLLGHEDGVLTDAAVVVDKD
jgi:hypothetical protein